MLAKEILALFTFLFPFVEGVGVIAAIHAVMKTKSPQAAIAWAISLVTFPWLAIPVYVVFGRSKFHGYVLLRGSTDKAIRPRVENLRIEAVQSGCVQTDLTVAQSALTKLADFPVLRYNKSELLINGRDTFASIFSAIDSATTYILIQFFIIRDDDLGREMQDRLLRKAKEGVRIFLLYDEIGSHQLPRSYLRELNHPGLFVSAFHSSRGRKNRFQINFRNHRKIVVVDGKVAFVGGHNVGNEYVSEHSRFGTWRDTHLKLQGPVVNAVQFSFVEDWYWARKEVPELNWEFEKSGEGEEDSLLIASGPADTLDTCGLMFTQVINDARERIWIASPYFVPDERVIGALKLAALRGVDVRILLPQKPDHYSLYLASFAFYPDVLPANIKLYRYTCGFLHQKVFLMDSSCAAVGTANLDNRSFHLNFELTLLNYSPSFIGQVERMLGQDFSHSRKVTLQEYTESSFAFKFAVRSSALLSPIL